MNTFSLVQKTLCPIVIILGLVSCSMNSTDSGGRTLALGDEVQIRPWESRFNGFLFFDDNRDFTMVTYQLDNGRGFSEEVTTPGFKLYVEHVNSTWYSPRTIEQIQNKQDLQRQLANFDGPFDFNAIANTSTGPTGWVATDGICQFAQFTIRLKDKSIYDNDQGQHDTVVSVSDCSRVITEVPEFFADFDFLDDATRSQLKIQYDD